MRRTIYALVSVLALAGGATPAMAKTVTQCMIEAVADCDAQFPSGDRWATAIRGWCYIIGTGMCKAME
jgi:hypothetical protein